MGDINHISFSQFQTYSACPLKWKLENTGEKFRKEDNVHALFGSSFHVALQELIKNHFSGSPKLDFINCLSLEMQNKFKSTQISYDIDEITSFLSDGIDMLSYINNNLYLYFPISKWELHSIEFPIEYKIKENLIFRGFIDLVLKLKGGDYYKIIDIKTSSKGWGYYETNDPIKLYQLHLYREYFSKSLSIPENKIILEYFIVKRKPGEDKKSVQILPVNSSDIHYTKKLFEDFIDKMFDEYGNYKNLDLAPANPSKSNCKFCQFKDKKDYCKYSYY